MPLQLPMRRLPLRAGDYKSCGNVTPALELVQSAVIVLAWRSRSPELGHEALCLSVHGRHPQIASVRGASISAGSGGPATTAQETMGCTGSSSRVYYDQIPMVAAQLLQAPAPITTPRLCDLLQRCVSEAKPNGWDPYGHGQGFRNLCWALTKDCLVAVYQNIPHWPMLMMAGQSPSVEPRAKSGLRESSPVLAMSDKGDRGNKGSICQVWILSFGSVEASILWQAR